MMSPGTVARRDVRVNARGVAANEPMIGPLLVMDAMALVVRNLVPPGQAKADQRDAGPLSIRVAARDSIVWEAWASHGVRPSSGFGSDPTGGRRLRPGRWGNC